MTKTDERPPPLAGQDEAAQPEVTYVLVDGSRRSVRTRPGVTIMQTALNGSVPGIEGECGGFLNCATCHVYVDEAWLHRLPPVSQEEDEMLDGAAAERRPNSRLSCRLKMSPDIDGVVVTMPARQM